MRGMCLCSCRRMARIHFPPVTGSCVVHNLGQIIIIGCDYIYQTLIPYRESPVNNVVDGQLFRHAVNGKLNWMSRQRPHPTRQHSQELCTAKNTTPIKVTPKSSEARQNPGRESPWPSAYSHRASPGPHPDCERIEGRSLVVTGTVRR